MPIITGTHPTCVELQLTHDSYPVWIGEGLLQQAGEFFLRHFPGAARQVVVVSDSNVAPLYSEALLQSLRESGFSPHLLVVPAGEASKSMEQVTSLVREMLGLGLDRKAVLVALGGGVVGDLAGFAAAIFQRGIPYVQIPTTIVSQVYSSVGGKTGVNTPEGKNLVGSFHQPVFVLADTSTLSTLPEREFNEGFAEIIKHAAIRDAALLSLVENREEIRQQLEQLVAANVAIKAAVVEADEKELTGTRALLNFGHTIGHGIEAAGGYGRFLHGEAISLGLVAAARLSVEHGSLPAADAARLIEALRLYQLPVVLPEDISDEAILSAMRRDKKFEAGSIRFVLLDRMGNAHVSKEIKEEHILRALEELRKP